MSFLKRITYLFIATLILASCSSDDDVIVEPLGDYEFGIFITNEGPFGTGTGTVSFLSDETNNVENTIYQNVNELELGNIVQSMYLNGDLAFIVVNNSNRIVVVNRYTFEEVARIEDGLINPRFMTIENGKGYVTNWGDPFDNSDDFIAVINLSSYEVDSIIPVGFGPEKITNFQANNKIFVLHQGGFDFNNIISVIDTNTNSVTSTIEIGDVPNSFFKDNDELWIMTGGKPDYSGDETNGGIYKINMINDNVDLLFEFNTEQHPSNLNADKSFDFKIYYLINGDLYGRDGNDVINGFIGYLEGSFYSLAVNRSKIYTTDAGDFASNGELKIYIGNDSSDSFEELNSYSVGIIPGGVYFNN